MNHIILKSLNFFFGQALTRMAWEKGADDYCDAVCREIGETASAQYKMDQRRLSTFLHPLDADAPQYWFPVDPERALEAGSEQHHVAAMLELKLRSAGLPVPVDMDADDFVRRCFFAREQKPLRAVFKTESAPDRIRLLRQLEVVSHQDEFGFATQEQAQAIVDSAYRLIKPGVLEELTFYSLPLRPAPVSAIRPEAPAVLPQPGG